MKRGQLPTFGFIMFELLLVLIIGYYFFYGSTHREAPVASAALDKQLTDLAVKTSFHVEHVRFSSSDQQPSRSVTSYGRGN